MVKDILMFGNIEIEKTIYCNKTPIFVKKMQIFRKYWYLIRLILMKKTTNTLFVACIMIKKLSYYI